MSSEKAQALHALLGTRAATRQIVDLVLAEWPEHAGYLLKSFEARSPTLLDSTESVAASALRLMKLDGARFAADYRWTCDRLRDEELFFHREGRYRLATFAEAYAEVYSDSDYMDRYMRGLLLTEVLWYNHIATFDMFISRVLPAMDAPFSYLEVGPGHGLMTYFASQSPLARSIEAWDVSEVSLSHTRAALDLLGAGQAISLVATDVMNAKPSRTYDLVVISEVLEHLERPDLALRSLRRAVAPGGRLFVNVPLNSPSPDHIYLFTTPQEVSELVEAAGFVVDQVELFATQGRPIEIALRQRISVSAGVVARPPSPT